jgi:hypothetical protein
MKAFACALCLCVPALLRADTLSELRSALRSLQGQEPVALRVERHTWKREEGKDTSGHEVFELEDGPKGLQSRDGKPLPGGDLKAEHLTRAQAELLDLLDQAVVIEERPDLLDGRPVRRLKVSIPLDTGDKTKTEKAKFKKFSLELNLWLGPDLLPLAVDKRMEVEGRVLLLMKFSVQAMDHRRYQRHKDRLVLMEASTEAQFKGMGKEGAEKELLRSTLK